jgi:hypothetical protein
MTNRDWLEGPQAELREYDPVRMGEMLDYAEDELIKSGAAVFQNGGRIIHPVRLDKDDNTKDVKRPAGALLIRDVAPMRLREYLIESCAFFQRDGKGKATRIPVPMELVHHFRAREDKWRLPVLNGIIETPTLRPDGSLLQEEGYDPASGLWLDFNGAVFPKVNDKPTKKDAKHALAKLKAILAGFPFVETELGESPSRSVALSAILTAIVRRSLHSAPMHASSAPTPGTGKTLLWDSIGRVGSGRHPSALPRLVT